LSKFIWAERAKVQLRAIDREQALDILHALTDYAASGKVEKDKYRILRVRPRKEAYRS
jgi:hypothetical protein